MGSQGGWTNSLIYFSELLGFNNSISKITIFADSQQCCSQPLFRFSPTIHWQSLEFGFYCHSNFNGCAISSLLFVVIVIIVTTTTRHNTSKFVHPFAQTTQNGWTDWLLKIFGNRSWCAAKQRQKTPQHKTQSKLESRNQKPSLNIWTSTQFECLTKRRTLMRRRVNALMVMDICMSKCLYGCMGVCERTSSTCGAWTISLKFQLERMEFGLFVQNGCNFHLWHNNSQRK